MKTGALIGALVLLAAPAAADWKDEILAAHNAVRAAVHLRPLTWNETLAGQAADYARYLAGAGTLLHSPELGLLHQGENLWMGGGARFKPEDMIGMWADEQAWYRGGPVRRSGEALAIGHYTQIVWRGTTEVGCGMAKVPDRLYVELDFLVCRYSPPGNVVGQRPY